MNRRPQSRLFHFKTTLEKIQCLKTNGRFRKVALDTPEIDSFVCTMIMANRNA